MSESFPHDSQVAPLPPQAEGPLSVPVNVPVEVGQIPPIEIPDPITPEVLAMTEAKEAAKRSLFGYIPSDPDRPKSEAVIKLEELSEIKPYDPSLEPNPDLIDPTKAAEFSQQELEEAQRAWQLFTTPQQESNISATNAPRIASSRLREKLIEEFGVEGLVNGFKILRKIYGEDKFKGLDPEIIPKDERTDLRDFLQIAGDGGQAIAEWEPQGLNHDHSFHLVGALLSTDNIAKLVRLGSRAAQRMPRIPKDDNGQRKRSGIADISSPVQEDIGDDVDGITLDIMNIWRSPGGENSPLNRLALELEDLRLRAGLESHVSKEDILFFVLEQKDIIDKMRKNPAFVSKLPAVDLN